MYSSFQIEDQIMFKLNGINRKDFVRIKKKHVHAFVITLKRCEKLGFSSRQDIIICHSLLM